jgi:hypothetical protein
VDSFTITELEGLPSDASKPIIAALMLATSLANDQLAPHVGGQSLADGFCYSYPAIEIAWPEDGQLSTDESFPWPLPRWQPFTKWLSFAKKWNESLDNWSVLLKEEDTPGVLVIKFCTLVYEVQQGSPHATIDNLSQLGEKLWGWADVPDKSDPKGKNDNNPDQRAFKDWATTMAIMLAAPESGLPKNDAEKLADGWFAARKKAPEKKAGKTSLREMVIRERSERAIWVLNCKQDEAKEKLQKYDGIPDSYQWLDAINKRMSENDKAKEMGNKAST